MIWQEVTLNNEAHKLKDSKWVACIAEIKNNETSEIVEYETNEILEEGDDYPIIFNWQEGNFSCDCNREIFFNRTKGLEMDFNNECSEGKYSVNLKNKVDGVYYYQEFETIS